MLRALVALALVGGCVQPDATSCAHAPDLICPTGTVCVRLTGPDEDACVAPEAIDACQGKAARDGCEVAGDTMRRCYDGACLPRGCGNGRLDPEEGEVCDDANAITGDGCSASCTSDERCGNGVLDPFVMAGAAAGEQCDDGNALGFDGCSRTCTLERPAWTELRMQTVQLDREGHVGVYDLARSRMVVFGGVRMSTGFLADTWEYTEGWRDISSSFGPRVRAYASAAYDTVRDRVVLFGGESRNGEVLGDTWELDGERWEPRTTSTAPPARLRASMAYDARRDVSVLVAGIYAGMQFDDTWEWDGARWTRREDVGSPGPQSEHVLAYDPARGVSILVGLTTDQQTTATWQYDGTRWTSLVTPVVPPARRGAALAWDPERRGLVLYGGAGALDGEPLGDTWLWDGTTWSALTATGGVARRGMSLVTAPDRDPPAILQFGGVDPTPAPGTYTSELRRWNSASATWQLVPRAFPGVRLDHDAVHDLLRHVIVDVGGPATASQTWQLDRGWREVTGAQPSSREGHAMAYDVDRRATVLFGGSTGGAPLATTWTFDGDAWAMATPATSPPGRTSHAMTHDRRRGQVVMFGGLAAGSVALGDTWVWDGTTWAPRPTTPQPPARSGHVLAYDAVRERVVMFGGRRTGGELVGDTWEWDGASWSERSAPVMPLPRIDASMAWSPARGRVVLFGGVTSGETQLNDLWEWDGATWLRIETPVPPSARRSAVLVPSPDGDGLLLIGGVRLIPHNEVWRLRWSTDEDLHDTCTGVVDGDDDDLRGCADPSCWHRCDPLCEPWLATCADDRPRCGDGTCSALESCRLCPGDCGPCAPVCGDIVCDPGESCPGDC